MFCPWDARRGGVMAMAIVGTGIANRPGMKYAVTKGKLEEEGGRDAEAPAT
jgi:hypothetical protein